MVSMTNLIEDIELCCAASGEVGLELADKICPDLILLDLSLPDIHGFDVLNKLKSNSRIKNIPVVAVSADAMDSTIKTALSDGCIDYITKPINFQTLMKVE